MWIFPLSLLIAFEIIADILAKEWSLKFKPLFWIGAIIAYVIANAFWLFALKYGSGLARGAAIFSVATTIFAIIIGAFYKESITQIQWVGISIGIVALILIYWNELQNVFFS